MDTRGTGRRSARITSALVSLGGLAVATVTGAGLWFGHEQAGTTTTDTSTSTTTDSGSGTGTSSDAATDSGSSSSSSSTETSTDIGVSQGTTGGSSDATTTGS
ncbi:hypothetical protein [Curtobacterium sp. KT1]|uniref:hypothetical protein n=1 Tax=Curtobacterium sp. KT1 TaxID=3372858 RepID=UPI0037C0999F